MTSLQMPATRVRFSWDLELADVDNDTNIDILVSCKQCEQNLLFINNGKGYFRDESEVPLFIHQPS